MEAILAEIRAHLAADGRPDEPARVPPAGAPVPLPPPSEPAPCAAGKSRNPLAAARQLLRRVPGLRTLVRRIRGQPPAPPAVLMPAEPGRLTEERICALVRKIQTRRAAGAKP